MTTTPSPATNPAHSPKVASATEVDAVQAALAGEHAAVWGYGLIGARLSDDDQDEARERLNDHAKHRDQLADLARDADATPVAAQAAYRLPFEVDDAESARRLAAELENRLTAAYADVVATADSDEVRTVGVRGLARSAEHAARWSGDMSAFPGLDGRTGSPVADIVD